MGARRRQCWGTVVLPPGQARSEPVGEPVPLCKARQICLALEMLSMLFSVPLDHFIEFALLQRALGML